MSDDEFKGYGEDMPTEVSVTDCDIETIEQAAAKCLENFGTPDVSGRPLFDYKENIVYLKNKHGYTTMIMSITDWNALLDRAKKEIIDKNMETQQ